MATSESEQPESQKISIEEWERLTRQEAFSDCPICGGQFVMQMGCRKICSCGYMEGCED